jgi:hypothetical protein
MEGSQLLLLLLMMMIFNPGCQADGDLFVPLPATGCKPAAQAHNLSTHCHCPEPL